LKDIPYIVASFQNNAQVIPEDKRSILDNAVMIKEKLGIQISSSVNAIKILQDQGYKLENEE
jgi:hypothetical protein